jgi:hypothetical protein
MCASQFHARRFLDPALDPIANFALGPTVGDPIASENLESARELSAYFQLADSLSLQPDNLFHVGQTKDSVGARGIVRFHQ